MGNSENRHLPVAIVNFVYYSVMFDENTQVIFVLGERFSIRRSRIVPEPTNRPEDAKPIALRDDRLILSDDDFLAQQLIACHAAAAQKRRIRTSFPDLHGAT
jgi:hypothetical protein